VEVEELGAEVEDPLFLHTPAFMVSAEEEYGTEVFFICTFIWYFVVRVLSSRDRPMRRATESLQRAASARSAAGNRSKMYAAIF
jgi:hypothetical protein